MLHVSSVEYIKEQGQKKQISYQMIAIVATKRYTKGKVYLAGTDLEQLIPNFNDIEHKIDQLCLQMKLTKPEEPLPIRGTLGFRIQSYGILKWKELFTPRQLLALLTFVTEVQMAYSVILEEAVDPDRAGAIITYLGMMIDRLAEDLSTLCRWNAVGGKLQGTFGRQALPMIWDFAESNPFGGSVGDAESILFNISDILKHLTSISKTGMVLRTTATSLPFTDSSIDALITDPPYYDNVPYADLSDFFYVWLKRSIGFLYPEHFSTPLTPKKQEAVMAAYRHNKNREIAKQSYESMMTQAFSEAHRVLKAG